MKKISKLKLNKVTISNISNLNEKQMNQVKGGFTFTRIQTQCTVNWCHSKDWEIGINGYGFCL